MLTRAQKIMLKRQIERRKKRNKAKMQMKPSPGAMVSYYRQLRNLVTELEKWTNELILPFLIEKESEYFKDDIGFDLSKAYNEFEKRIELLKLGEKGIELVEPALYQGDNFNRKAFISGLKQTIGVDVSSMLNEDRQVKRAILGRIDDNIDLIKSIPAQYLDSLKSTISEGITSGNNYQSIRKEIYSLGQSTKKRAKFIARDQLSKFNNDLNRVRQENIGITKYIWRTAGDSRVSDEHAENDGQIFEWDNPPPTGHPGERPNCRCTAEPYLDDLLRDINRQVDG